MILKASQRSGAAHLATHLTNTAENDHVSVVEMRGFVSDSVHEAFAEAHAISKATKCKQILFSLSMSPPAEAVLSDEDFQKAADTIEAKLGLTDQPRALIVHEKDGRRHAHVVWSRIDLNEMKAINLPFFKQRLNELSKEFYLDHGWSLPDGLKTHHGKNPLNFTREEWQQAKRADLDPREIKAIFREAFKRSDTLQSFGQALAEKGYFIAKGDRRGFVAINLDGDVFAIPRWTGAKSKEVKAKLGSPDGLEPVQAVKDAVSARVTTKLKTFMEEVKEQHATEQAPLKTEKREMVLRHRRERQEMGRAQKARHAQESRTRASRFRTGVKGMLDWVIGRNRTIRLENEQEAERCKTRDQDERQSLILTQMTERQSLQKRIEEMMKRHSRDRASLAEEIVHYMRIAEQTTEITKDQGREHDPMRHHNRGRERTK